MNFNRVGTELGYKPIAPFCVFPGIHHELDPPPQIGIDTNLQFGIFQKKGTYPPV